MFKRFNTVGELLTYLSTLPKDMMIYTETEVMNFEPGIGVFVEKISRRIRHPDEFEEKVPVLLVDGRD